MGKFVEGWVCSNVRNLHASGVFQLVSYVQIGVPHVVDEVGLLAVLARLPGHVACLPALYAEVPVGYVLRRDRLLPFHRLPLLLHLQITEDGNEEQKHNESHAATDYQAETPCQEAAHAAHVAHRRAVATDHRLWRLECFHLGATTRGRIRHLHIRRRFERLVVGEVKLIHRVLLETLAHPVSQSKHADQIPSVWQELGQFRGT